MNIIERQLAAARLAGTVVCGVLIWSALLAGPDTLVRDSIPDKYKWDLADIYPDWQSWESDYNLATDMIDSLARLKGQASRSADQLLHILQFRDLTAMTVDRVSLFADLSYITSMADDQLSGRNQRAENLTARLAENTSWLEPELLKLPQATIDNWSRQTAGLADYRYWLTNLFRLKPHYLDENGEKLLSYFRPFNGSADAVYAGFVYSDIQYPWFVRSNGDSLRLTEGQVWYQMRTNRDQDERRRMFQAFYRAYDAYVNTYSAMYNNILQRDWAMARARHYDDALQSFLNVDNVPPEVYRNLVTTVRAGTQTLQKYHQLRRRALGLAHYYWSDRQTPLASVDRSYEFDQIVPWMFEAMAPLGPDYGAALRKFFEQRRIDVYENEDKYTGGFQSDAYGTPQYILMNFNGTLEEVFTLAHEAGHAMHSYYSNSHQPYVNAYSTIFVAEVPSTLNEALLLDYLMERTESPAERVAMLQRAIENIEGTFFLQTMFADFEWQTHGLVENGEPVTAEALRDIYGRLLKDYYGDAIEIDSLYFSYWTRIGHFFESPYYVYKYATSFAASARIVKAIQSGDPSVRERGLKNYLTLLQAGGSDYPMTLLKNAGVDPGSPEPVRAVIDQLDALVKRLEVELDRL